MLTGGVAPLSWRFLGGLLLASASSGTSSSLVWKKSTVGQTMALISPYEISCIVCSLLICPLRFDVLANIIGEFLADSTYSELSPFTPKLASDMMSLSESAGGLGEEILPSVGCPRFEFLLKLPTAVGVAMSGAAVLVRTLAAWEVSARDGKTGRSDPLVRVLVDDAGASG